MSKYSGEYQTRDPVPRTHREEPFQNRLDFPVGSFPTDPGFFGSIF